MSSEWDQAVEFTRERVGLFVAGGLVSLQVEPETTFTVEQVQAILDAVSDRLAEVIRTGEYERVLEGMKL